VTAPFLGDRRRRLLATAAAWLLLLASFSAALAVAPDLGGGGGGTSIGTDEPSGHLVVSELVTGGASASDEMIELFNPTADTLPLEGLELIYVSASGATISRKATWPLGAPSIPGGSHVLIANEAGVFASIADVMYANGIAAAGGSVALRILGATTAIDALGWGTAANVWLEGNPAPAPAAGHSLERLPGGADGSGQDTNQNALDFVEQPTPDPQNSASPPTPSPTASPVPSGSPAATPSPTVAPTASPSATPGATPTALPSPTPTPAAVISIEAARALPDGSTATVEGVALTGSTFTDGGGFIQDSTAGIAVLVSDGTFDRGQRLQVTGELDDRYHQRTMRAAGADVVPLGSGIDPDPIDLSTGAVGEANEGRLAHLGGTIMGAPTPLSGALAFDVDDGSGAARVVVADATGIATADWQTGASVEVRAVIGQRDSSGTGTSGYRAMPRDPADVIAVTPPPTPSPSPTPGGPSPSPSGNPGDPLVTIAQARGAALNAHMRVRGVVTLPSGLHEPGSAAIQDASGAILLRLSDEAGSLSRGVLVEVDGARSTKAGMASLRVSDPPRSLGEQAEPDALRRATGAIGESEEALLLVARGAITSSVLRSSAGNVYFDLDDGSGPLRVFVSPRANIPSASLAPGVWLEIVGVLTQETTGRQPERGYRLWPREAADLRILAGPVGESPAPYANGDSGGTPYLGPDAGSALVPGRIGPVPASGEPGGAPPAPGPGGGGLGLALPTTSPPPSAWAVDPSAPGGSEDPSPGPLAGLLVLLGGAGMAGAGFMVAPPGLAQRLMALLRGESGTLADDAQQVETSTAPFVAEPADPAARLRLLSPSSVLSGEASTLSDGRILPPT
jgi:hypothetical protein